MTSGTEISNEHQVRGTGGAGKETENTKANTSAYVSIRQHTSAFLEANTKEDKCIRRREAGQRKAERIYYSSDI